MAGVYSLVAVRGLLVAGASLVVEHGLQGTQASGAAAHGLRSCGMQAYQLLRGMWDLPRPGIEPMSPALAGGFFTTESPVKPWAPSDFDS